MRLGRHQMPASLGLCRRTSELESAFILWEVKGSLIWESYRWLQTSSDCKLRSKELIVQASERPNK